MCSSFKKLRNIQEIYINYEVFYEMVDFFELALISAPNLILLSSCSENQKLARGC